MTARPPHVFPIPPAAPMQACRSCGACIYWVITGNNRNMPVNPDGISHFVTCPEASSWRKGRA